MLFTARCFQEPLRFRDADGIASTLAGGDLVAEMVKCGCLIACGCTNALREI